jgi:hypothetical protein
MKFLVLLTLLAISSVSYAASTVEYLNCRTVNGLTINVDLKGAKVRYMGVSRDFDVASFTSFKDLTTVQLVNPKTMGVGIVETYIIHLKGTARPYSRTKMTGVVSKMIVNLLNPIPVETVPVSVKCELSYSDI